MEMGAFVVKEDALFSRIRSRAIDTTTHRLARQIAVIGEKAGADSGGRAFKLRGRAEPEATQEQRPVRVQLFFDKLEVGASPLGQVQLAQRRLDQQWQAS